MAALGYGSGDRRRLASAAESIAARCRPPLVATNDAGLPPSRTGGRLPMSSRPSASMCTVGCGRHASGCQCRAPSQPAEEMRRLFRNCPEAVEEGGRILRQLSFSLAEPRASLPRRADPAGRDAADGAGAADRARRVGSAIPAGVPEKVQQQLEHELALIERLKLPALLPHRARHRPLARARSRRSSARAGARAANSLGLLLPRHHVEVDPNRGTTSCSSASSRQSARSHPTSTSTSSMSGARK